MNSAPPSEEEIEVALRALTLVTGQDRSGGGGGYGGGGGGYGGGGGGGSRGGSRGPRRDSGGFRG